MNYAIIFYTLGVVIDFSAAFMIPPFLVAVLYGETDAKYFLLCFAICVVLGIFLGGIKPENKKFYAREGYVMVSLSWIIISLIGALPFYLSGYIPSYLDAMFETISGFTTTGATILTDVEVLSHGMLFWRSFTHWIGGMGVLVFILAILPLAGGENMHLMKAESPGPSVGKLVPKLRKSAFYLYAIYFSMTVIEVILLTLNKMPVFDAVCISMGTAGTGGFGIKNTSMAGYTGTAQTIVTIFMLLFGVNFSFFFLILMRKFREAFKMTEVRCYLAIFAIVSLLISINITFEGGSFISNFHASAFAVSSIMTTTGFSTVDFNQWPEFSRTLLVIIMFSGACAGSTGGGIKISRFLIYIKSAAKEMASLIHPRSVKVIKFDGKPVERNVLRSATVFLITYFFLYTVSVVIVSLDNFDLITTFTAVAATFNNIGPGLELVGPSGNFAMFSPLSKVVLIFDMLAGRLEIFPLLLLFTPSVWKKY
ncbi:TrkH family potassium uptake protein [Lachnospiraceae bacterium NSJ-143]|nr:TrkH family potassium uptake protein [Lachnospiraceae bacterium NSJ-143]